jgi:uncharacterized membrane protein
MPNDLMPNDLVPNDMVPNDMARLRDLPDDHELDTQIGMLLRIGVSIAAVVIAVGGVVFLAQHGREHFDYTHFHGTAQQLRSLHGISGGVVHGNGPAIIQLGLLLLIATPIARVTFSVFAFLKERDLLYFSVSAIVLAVLLYSLLIH